MVFRPPLEFIVRQQGRFRRALEDLSGLWRRFLPILSAMETDWFESHGEGAWPPLAESTLRSKAAKGYSLEPLITDERDDSLHQTLIDPNRAARIEPGMLIWETEVPYAHFHQDGGEVEGRPPKRQVIPDPLPLQHRRQIESATVSWLNEEAAIAFGRL
jgi:hypothetical protein